ncbi:MAG: hypothetical protein NTU99_03295 [Pseudanabaena sp. LacPavin_0818_WC45_MAG_42_6]|nr:hypothetical protein [Pseudanabaena sp. LacPavin_0818_WC45_MAG_42_6]
MSIFLSAIAPERKSIQISHPHQTAIASRHLQTRAPIHPNQKVIALPSTKPDRLFPTANNDCPLTTHKAQSPKFQNQTAIRKD